MTSEQIHTSLDNMLANPKSKNFLNHLVRSYLPVTNVKVIDMSKGELKCVITRDKLASGQEILESLNVGKIKDEFIEGLKLMFDDKADKTSSIFNVIGEKKLAVTGKETTTFMSFTSYQEFCKWIMNKSAIGDKHINWLLASMRRAAIAEKGVVIQDEAKIMLDKIRKNNKAKVATFALGDATDVLSKLKASLESNGQ